MQFIVKSNSMLLALLGALMFVLTTIQAAPTPQYYYYPSMDQQSPYFGREGLRAAATTEDYYNPSADQPAPHFGREGLRAAFWNWCKLIQSYNM